MNICYCCNASLDSIDLLCTHLKYVHFLEEACTYKCCQYKCPQMFTCFKAFKKHLKTSHYNDNIDINVPHKIQKISDNDNWFSDSIPSTSSNKVDDSIAKISLNKDSCSNSENNNKKKAFFVDEVKNSFFHFFLKLHSKSHMTNKQIEEITTDFSQNITLLLDNLKNNIIDSVCDEKKLHVTNVFNSYTECLSDFKTEYRLNKYLLSNSIMKPPLSFVVQNDVREVIKKGTPCLVEKVESGYIMPIANQMKSYFKRYIKLHK